jgi:copper chaperone
MPTGNSAQEIQMLKFRVPGMKCGGCAKAVTHAIAAIDPSSKIEIDIDAKEVTVTSSFDEHVISSALEEAGYPVGERLMPNG